MPTTLRVEIFPADLDATVIFYTTVLGFSLVTDQRATHGYVALERDHVRIGAAARRGPVVGEVHRPPTGVELVLEVDDIVEERDRVLAQGWPLEEDLCVRPWGLTDFRLLDPCGNYLRLTNRPQATESEQQDG
jgi:catechol 2,3-dioxygenase-like lactoylglutathione lyase family enzyme